jgi:hypothetical protein
MASRLLWHTLGLAASLLFAVSTAGTTEAATHQYLLPTWAWLVLSLASFIGILRYVAWYRA